jgi:hypothetical protein
MQHQPIADPDIRVLIPVPIVKHMLQFAHRHYRALIWQPDILVHINPFRAILAVCTNYCNFCHAGTGVRCHIDDIAVDTTGGNICLFLRKAKGDQRRPAADRSLLQLPSATIPVLADLIETFSDGRTNIYKHLDNGPEPATFWTVTHDKTPHAWTAGTITELIREACNAIGASTPRNSNGHRITYGRARCPPPHASAHPSPRFATWVVGRNLAMSSLVASTSTLP